MLEFCVIYMKSMCSALQGVCKSLVEHLLCLVRGSCVPKGCPSAGAASTSWWTELQSNCRFKIG